MIGHLHIIPMRHVPMHCLQKLVQSALLLTKLIQTLIYFDCCDLTALVSSSHAFDFGVQSLTCRLSSKDECGDRMEAFLARCFYQPGQYKEESDFATLSDRMSEVEGVQPHLPNVCKQYTSPSQCMCVVKGERRGGHSCSL